MEELKGELPNTRLKYIELKDDLAAVQFGLTNRLVKVARAAGVEHVQTQTASSLILLSHVIYFPFYLNFLHLLCNQCIGLY